MTFAYYQEAFKKNLMIMSRTANGILDLSASKTKKDSMEVTDKDKAKNLALENTFTALKYLYKNRFIEFANEEELANFILNVARITDKGVVKKNYLFRNGESSPLYVEVKDVNVFWQYFIYTLYNMLISKDNDVIKAAAFTEYLINITAHFFSDGCGKISMLISTFIFMRYDKKCITYPSRDEYYSFCSNLKKPSVNDLDYLLDSIEFNKFLSYYKSIYENNN